MDHLNVETPILESKDGAVMTMLNWNAEKLPVLHIKVRVPFTVKAVESVTIGAIQFSQYKDEVSFSESLDGADLVMLKR